MLIDMNIDTYIYMLNRLDELKEALRFGSNK